MNTYTFYYQTEYGTRTAKYVAARFSSAFRMFCRNSPSFVVKPEILLPGYDVVSSVGSFSHRIIPAKYLRQFNSDYDHIITGG